MDIYLFSCKISGLHLISTCLDLSKGMDVMGGVYDPDQKFCIAPRSDRKTIQFCLICQHKPAGTK